MSLVREDFAHVVTIVGRVVGRERFWQHSNGRIKPWNGLTGGNLLTPDRIKPPLEMRGNSLKLLSSSPRCLRRSLHLPLLGISYVLLPGHYSLLLLLIFLLFILYRKNYDSWIFSYDSAFRWFYHEIYLFSCHDYFWLCNWCNINGDTNVITLWTLFNIISFHDKLFL